MWRVTYQAYGRPGWIDLHCELDAIAFVAWGDESGAFINGAYHRVGADEGYGEAASME